MRFGIFIYDGVEPIDLATFGVLSMARRVAPEIAICTIAPRAGPVALANGLTVTADFGKYGIQIFARKREQYARGGRSDRHIRRLIRHEVGLTEKLALRKKRDPKIATVNALTEHFDLPLGNDKEFAQIPTFDDKRIADRDVFLLELAGHLGQHRLRHT